MLKRSLHIILAILCFCQISSGFLLQKSFSWPFEQLENLGGQANSQEKDGTLESKVSPELYISVLEAGREVFQLWNEVIGKYGEESLVSLDSEKKKEKQILKNEWKINIKSDVFPSYQVRIKDTEDLGIDKVKQMTGYLDTESDKHFFFWFFESRNKPETDPIILWLNGGPGCSSMTGLFMELGPAKVNPDNFRDPIHNPYSWNNNASIIFLDQPVNSGFSYSNEDVSDSLTSAKDVFAFLTLFFQQFPEYAKLDFSLAGESYAGHYLPQIAKEIVFHTKHGGQTFFSSSKTKSEFKPNFSLKKMLIGNGFTDPLVQYKYYSRMACKNTYEPILTEEQCNAMEEAYPRCRDLIQRCYDSDSKWFCIPAFFYCNNVMLGPFQRTGRNVYDIRKDCIDKANLCYPITGVIANYLNEPFVKKAIGAEIENYQSCNMTINIKFALQGDWMRRVFVDSVRDILNMGVDVLIYAGDADFICNWYGNKAWTEALEWKYGNEYRNSSFNPWKLSNSDKHVGNMIKYKNLAFLQIFEAGHMVPYDKPEVALDMLNRFLREDL